MGRKNISDLVMSVFLRPWQKQSNVIFGGQDASRGNMYDWQFS